MRLQSFYSTKHVLSVAISIVTSWEMHVLLEGKGRSVIILKIYVKLKCSWNEIAVSTFAADKLHYFRHFSNVWHSYIHSINSMELFRCNSKPGFVLIIVLDSKPWFMVDRQTMVCEVSLFAFLPCKSLGVIPSNVFIIWLNSGLQIRFKPWFSLMITCQPCLAWQMVLTSSSYPSMVLASQVMVCHCVWAINMLWTFQAIIIK